MYSTSGSCEIPSTFDYCSGRPLQEVPGAEIQLVKLKSHFYHDERNSAQFCYFSIMVHMSGRTKLNFTIVCDTGKNVHVHVLQVHVDGLHHMSTE